MDHVSDENEPGDIGDLIRLDDHQAHGHTGADAPTVRLTVDGPRKKPKREREEGEGLNLSDVLHTPCGRGAESERQRGDDRTRRVPAAIAEEKHDGEAAEREQAERIAVDEPEARRGIQ